MEFYHRVRCYICCCHLCPVDRAERAEHVERAERAECAEPLILPHLGQ